MESEWLVTLATLELDDVIYTDYVKAAKELVPELQSEVWPCYISMIHFVDVSFLSHLFLYTCTCIQNCDQATQVDTQSLH